MTEENTDLCQGLFGTYLFLWFPRQVRIFDGIVSELLTVSLVEYLRKSPQAEDLGWVILEGLANPMWGWIGFPRLKIYPPYEFQVGRRVETLEVQRVLSLVGVLHHMSKDEIPHPVPVLGKGPWPGAQ